MMADTWKPYYYVCSIYANLNNNAAIKSLLVNAAQQSDTERQ